MSARIALSVLLLPACFVETYSVSVDSTEVREGAIVMQLDRSAADEILRVEVHLVSQQSDACPVIESDVQLLLTAGAETSELAVSERGGGSRNVECAIKCHDPIAFGTSCSPVRAELRGAALTGAAFLRLQDATASLGAGLAETAIAPRSVELLDGEIVGVGPADAPVYSFTEVPFAWSHDDRVEWVSEWPEQVIGTRDGDFSEFNLVRGGDQIDGVQAFNVRNTADRGTRSVFFGATAPVETCEVATCSGIEHVIATTIRVVDR